MKKISDEQINTDLMSEQKGKCPECGGLELITIAGCSSTNMVDCPTCNGTGQKKLDYVRLNSKTPLEQAAFDQLNFDKERVAFWARIEEAKRETEKRIVIKLYNIEFEADSAVDFLNKVLEYIGTLEGD